MPVFAIVNRKGGSGKSTLATQLAACLAHHGLGVMLGDLDRQASALTWLRRRAELQPPVVAISGRIVDPRTTLHVPPGVSYVVLDTPGALHGFELARTVMFADAVLMPVCHSAFDRESAADCFAELRRHPRVASGRCRVAAVGMRIDARTHGEQALREWAQALGLPFVGVLRETQNYVRCSERGLAIFDLPPARVQTDLDQWPPILAWLAPPPAGAAVPAQAVAGEPATAPAPRNRAEPADPALPAMAALPADPALPAMAAPAAPANGHGLWSWLLPRRSTSHRGRH
jgi:chromosome partitioning protein